MGVVALPGFAEWGVANPVQVLRVVFLHRVWGLIFCEVTDVPADAGQHYLRSLVEFDRHLLFVHRLPFLASRADRMGRTPTVPVNSRVCRYRDRLRPDVVVDDGPHRPRAAGTQGTRESPRMLDRFILDSVVSLHDRVLDSVATHVQNACQRTGEEGSPPLPVPGGGVREPPARAASTVGVARSCRVTSFIRTRWASVKLWAGPGKPGPLLCTSARAPAPGPVGVRHHRAGVLGHNPTGVCVFCAGGCVLNWRLAKLRPPAICDVEDAGGGL